MLKKSAKRALMFISVESCDEKALFWSYSAFHFMLFVLIRVSDWYQSDNYLGAIGHIVQAIGHFKRS